jgi:putative phage DNA packaging protein (terminase)
VFVESKYILDYNRRVKTPFGYQRIEEIHKTKILKSLKFIHERGELTVAEFHTFIIDEEEFQANEMRVGDHFDTVDGKSKILEIQDAGEQELYDITLDQSEFENFWYYTGGVLSHNSGKSITVACYLSWLYNFHKNLTIGIVANRGAQAREFLQNVKDIISRLPIWLMQGTEIWNKRDIKNEIGSRILTDVPGPDAFRGYTCNVLTIDECAFIKTSVWEEFADSIFPSQSALSWKKNIIISTAKGLNHFYDLVQKAKLDEMQPNSKTAFIEVHWDEVPRYDSKGNLMEPEEFKRQIIKRYGRVYFEQNYGNSFVGSSETLIAPEVLAELQHKNPIAVWDDMLRLYYEPQQNHTYIMSVDAAKEGKDYFAIQVIDVTEMPFRQVAAANLQVDYLTMPDFLYEWGARFNTAHMIIENNEGAGQSIADMLVNHFEYPNIYYQDNKYKYPGFRTTKSTRDSIIRMLQILINSGKLEICDKETISEFQRFELVNDKYQASSGHDDLVMALAISIAPMTNMDNFSDFGKFLDALKSDEVLDSGAFFEIGDLAFEDF